MDNLTHSLAGWALGQAGLKEKSRKGLAALILGANAPDIDVFFAWAPWEPLATHRGFTHSLVGGVVILPAMLFALLYALDRWQVRRGTRFKSGYAMRPFWLLALCYIGALTHPLLDLQTTYSVQLLSPFSGLWFHADSLFIIDVWMWALLGLGIAWSRMREKQGAPGYRRAAQAAIVIGVVYTLLNFGLSERAKADVRRSHPKATSIFASPDPVFSWRRGMVWRNDALIHRANWSPGSGLGAERKPVSDNLDNPDVGLALRRDSNLRAFLYWSVMPVAQVVRDGCVASVMIADARYGIPGPNEESRISRATRVDRCA